MQRREDIIRLHHMLEAAEQAIQFCSRQGEARLGDRSDALLCNSACD